MSGQLHVEMLGGLRVWAGETPVLADPAYVRRPWHLFCYLLLNPGKALPAAALAATLWPHEALLDADTLMDELVEDLNHEFARVGAALQPVQEGPDGYTCNPDITWETDTTLFEQKLRLAAESGPEGRLRLLMDALELYRGELLPKMEAELWVAPLDIHYRQLFSAAAANCCQGLQDAGRHNELLAVASAATAVEPLEENLYLYLFQALDAMEMYRAIIPAYNRVARLFAEEFGHPPGDEIEAIHQKACTHVDPLDRDVLVIKDELRAAPAEDASDNAPLYCTYDVFKYLYQMVSRVVARSGGHVVLLLLTIDDGSGAKPSTRLLSSAMNQVKNAILGGLLRKSDTFTRYSLNQYLIMLTTDKPTGAATVEERIKARCQPMLAPAGLGLVLSTTQMEG